MVGRELVVARWLWGGVIQSTASQRHQGRELPSSAVHRDAGHRHMASEHRAERSGDEADICGEEEWSLQGSPVAQPQARNIRKWCKPTVLCRKQCVVTLPVQGEGHHAVCCPTTGRHCLAALKHRFPPNVKLQLLSKAWCLGENTPQRAPRSQG